MSEKNNLITLGGVKHDQEKPDLALLPKEALDGIARAFMVGEKKYGRYNYLKGMEWTRLISALMRHVTAFNSGEDFDKESGLNHIYHAGACVMMLIAYYENNLGKDNRYKNEKN